jgi:hypothetical protein
MLEEMIALLPSKTALELRSVFSKIMRDIAVCHKGLAILAKEKVDSLVSDLNYMSFDLEATRRERDEYKRKLGE